jgi:hypothetical protein
MKTYKCFKRVKATPMNRLDYNELRNWDLPEDEDGTDEGYLVEYIDGGTPNHKDYLGYLSWSPREQFENGYKEEPKDFLGRLTEEIQELAIKIDSLQYFLQTTHFNTLGLDHRVALTKQHRIMGDYLKVLKHRLNIL